MYAGLFLRTLLGKCDHVGSSGEPLRREVHLPICVANKTADRAVGVADWDVNLAAVEADREVLRRRLRKAQLLSTCSVYWSFEAGRRQFAFLSQPLSSAQGRGAFEQPARGTENSRVWYVQPCYVLDER